MSRNQKVVWLGTKEFAVGSSKTRLIPNRHPGAKAIDVPSLTFHAVHHGKVSKPSIVVAILTQESIDAIRDCLDLIEKNLKGE